MSKKVSEEQMEELFAFTRKHFVEHYDLQTELADHMANAIEDCWTTDPTLDFARAKEQEFKKFGVFGFMGVVEERQIALNKKYYKLMWGYFKEFFKLPSIVLTIGLIFFTYIAISYSIIIYSVIVLAVIILSFYKIIVSSIKYKKKVKLTGKKWLFEEIIMKFGGMGGFTFLPYQIILQVYENEPPTWLLLPLAVMLVAFVLYNYVIFYILPSKAEEHLIATYPEYNLKF